MRNNNTSDKKKILNIFRHKQIVKNPKMQKEYAIAYNEFYALFKKNYSKYIEKINPAKVILLYKEYVYYSSSRWIEIKKYQLK